MDYKILIVEGNSVLSQLFERALNVVAKRCNESARLQILHASSVASAKAHTSLSGANEFDLISVGSNLPRSQNGTKSPFAAKEFIAHLDIMETSARVVYYGIFDQMYEQISKLTVSSVPVTMRMRSQTDSQEDGKASVGQWADLCVGLVMRGK